MPNFEPYDPPESRSIEPLGHLESLTVIVPILESLLDDRIDDVSPAMRAQLVLMMQWPALPQAVCVQAAFGRDAGEQNLERTHRLIAEARRRGVCVDCHISDLHAEGRIPEDELNRLFLGASSRRPDAQRLRGALVLMSAAADASPHELHPPLLSAMGWMLWALGRPDEAMKVLTEAADIGSPDPLPHSLMLHFSDGPPAWLE